MPYCWVRMSVAGCTRPTRLAYVYQLRQYQAGKGRRPDPLRDVPIPTDLQRDE
ncbi:hypothetical protein FHR87_000185 [Azomonas macrocytogenes]|uniref:Transposase n=1 Tax=Azomonas macrocytogenes TaxID=69962 RepID=A0A839T1J8_AZOMA|nr:hypothetical protein [Azomonas macrocytogenes]MBB3101825.1 hypothetical protein [Azomonas macrocytogenes]